VSVFAHFWGAGRQQQTKQQTQSYELKDWSVGNDLTPQDKRWLQVLDDMKFSHSIQFNAVPDWSGKYINYSNLKKL